jgi:hypothetical protein
MGVFSMTSVNDLQEVGTVRYAGICLRVYWKKDTKEVCIIHEGREYIQPDGLIGESLAQFIPMPTNVSCCLLYEPNGSPSLPMNEPNDLLLCEWSDFACDRLLIQATLL